MKNLSQEMKANVNELETNALDVMLGKAYDAMTKYRLSDKDLNSMDMTTFKTHVDKVIEKDLSLILYRKQAWETTMFSNESGVDIYIQIKMLQAKRTLIKNQIKKLKSGIGSSESLIYLLKRRISRLNVV
ncbi:hypothetical protein RF11_09501 [Thelohanellus kitauei]|uniref:Uncharacterized protein n=1 Tax=Thelohanellus kitauei TaxID=669202 RepID=A0A0C2N4F5_THEKT|nr:hypothetical protein RF11_09501 [Thelohanellus kitauei]